MRATDSTFFWGEVDRFPHFFTETLKLDQEQFDRLRFLDYACRRPLARIRFHECVLGCDAVFFKMNELDWCCRDSRILWKSLRELIVYDDRFFIYFDQFCKNEKLMDCLQHEIHMIFQGNYKIQSFKPMQLVWGKSTHLLKNEVRRISDYAQKFRLALFDSSIVSDDLCKCFSEVINRIGPRNTLCSQVIIEGIKELPRKNWSKDRFIFFCLAYLAVNNESFFAYFVDHLSLEDKDFFSHFCYFVGYSNSCLAEKILAVKGDNSELLRSCIQSLPVDKSLYI